MSPKNQVKMHLYFKKKRNKKVVSISFFQRIHPSQLISQQYFGFLLTPRSNICRRRVAASLIFFFFTVAHRQHGSAPGPTRDVLVSVVWNYPSSFNLFTFPKFIFFSLVLIYPIRLISEFKTNPSDITMTIYWVDFRKLQVRFPSGEILFSVLYMLCSHPSIKPKLADKVSQVQLTSHPPSSPFCMFSSSSFPEATTSLGNPNSVLHLSTSFWERAFLLLVWYQTTKIWIRVTTTKTLSFHWLLDPS